MAGNENTIILGVLLSNIGRFYERTLHPLSTQAERYNADVKYSYQAYSAMFVDELPEGWGADKDALRRLVLMAHSPVQEDEWLTHLALRFSGTQKVKQEEGDNRATQANPLRTVLSSIEIDDKRAAAPLYQPLVTLPLNRIASRSYRA
jgi:hypothetical protein